jgi:glycosyltransferase involved in cell wall biosynthesis
MNIQPSFPFTGAPIYIDTAVTGKESLPIVTRGLVTGLRENHVPAFALGYNKDDPEFYQGRHLVTLPPPFKDLEAYDYTYVDCGMPQVKQLAMTAKRSIAITAVDDFRWNLPHTQHAWKAYDQIVTFSKYSQKYLTEKLKFPIGYFPLGVDSKVFHPIRNPVIPDFSAPGDIEFKNFPFDVDTIYKKIYIYLAVGYMQERKGMKELFHAYFQAFYGQPDVLLWIHGPTGSWSDERIPRELKIFTNPNSPMVIWTKKKLLTDELVNLFNVCDCYVHPHHLEGFGMGVLQALACRKPIIVSAFAGPMDYVPKKGVRLLEVKETEKFIHKSLDLMPWGEYSQEDLMDALKFPPQEIPPNVVSDWTWRQSAEKFLEYVSVYGEITKHTSGITICIPCWKDWQSLHKLLTSLTTIPAGMPFKVLVANDGNTPEVSSTCQRFKVKEVVIAQSTGLGFVRNMLLANVTTEYMIYLDCDIVITTPHWLSEWYNAHRKLGRKAISTIPQFGNDGLVNFAGHNIIGKPSYYYHQSTAVPVFQHRQVVYSQTSAMMVESAFIQSIGFCEEYKLYYDDVDFCLYAKKHGGTIHYLPVVSLIHAEHSANKISPIDSGKVGREIYESYWGTKPALNNSALGSQGKEEEKPNTNKD